MNEGKGKGGGCGGKDGSCHARDLRGFPVATAMGSYGGAENVHVSDRVLEVWVVAL
jgi:hypothetical protein